MPDWLAITVGIVSGLVLIAGALIWSMRGAEQRARKRPRTEGGYDFERYDDHHYGQPPGHDSIPPP